MREFLQKRTKTIIMFSSLSWAVIKSTVFRKEDIIERNEKFQIKEPIFLFICQLTTLPFLCQQWQWQRLCCNHGCSLAIEYYCKLNYVIKVKFNANFCCFSFFLSIFCFLHWKVNCFHFFLLSLISAVVFYFWVVDSCELIIIIIKMSCVPLENFFEFSFILFISFHFFVFFFASLFCSSARCMSLEHSKILYVSDFAYTFNLQWWYYGK